MYNLKEKKKSHFGKNIFLPGFGAQTYIFLHLEKDGGEIQLCGFVVHVYIITNNKCSTNKYYLVVEVL